MSVNRDEMDMDIDNGAAPYSDHEHVNIGVALKADPGEQADTFNSVDPVAEELDSNEVAELIYYSHQINVTGGFLEYGLGFNVSDDDFVEQSANNQTTFNTGGFSGSDAVAVYEEPGIIAASALGDGDDVDDGSDGRYQISYRGTDSPFSMGPFVDQTDDLDIHLEFSNQTNSDQTADLAIQLVYRIQEVAQGVPQFSDPRRLMR